jgi:hypothetical protein
MDHTAHSRWVFCTSVGIIGGAKSADLMTHEPLEKIAREVME